MSRSGNETAIEDLDASLPRVMNDSVLVGGGLDNKTYNSWSKKYSTIWKVRSNVVARVFNSSKKTRTNPNEK